MSNSRPTSAWQSSQAPTSRPLTARPRTGQSRPETARPRTAASTRHEGSYVVAVFEGRGIAREVGMAAFDKDTGRVMLIQVHDDDASSFVHDMYLMQRVLPASGLSDVRENAASDAPPHAICHLGPRYLLGWWRCVVEEVGFDVCVGAVYSRRVSRSTCRTCREEVLE
jgi:hypothetical protein